MNSFLVRVMPMLLAMIISQLIYFIIDNKCNITNKINSRCPIRQEFKALFCICCVLISIIIIGIVGIYIIDMDDTLYGIIVGVLAGIGISISVKLPKKKI